MVVACFLCHDFHFLHIQKCDIYIIFTIECIDWNSITVFFTVAADQSAEKLEEKLDAHDEEPTAEETNEEKWWIDQVLKVANVLFISFW